MSGWRTTRPCRVLKDDAPFFAPSLNERCDRAPTVSSMRPLPSALYVPGPGFDLPSVVTPPTTPPRDADDEKPGRRGLTFRAASPLTVVSFSALYVPGPTLGPEVERAGDERADFVVDAKTADFFPGSLPPLVAPPPTAYCGFGS